MGGKYSSGIHIDENYLVDGFKKSTGVTNNQISIVTTFQILSRLILIHESSESTSEDRKLIEVIWDICSEEPLIRVHSVSINNDLKSTQFMFDHRAPKEVKIWNDDGSNRSFPNTVLKATVKNSALSESLKTKITDVLYTPSKMKARIVGDRIEKSLH
jgi:hypothetical protein